MMYVRKGDERGHFDFGWLNTYHTFSFGSYYDPEFMGFRSLRVINEDRVVPGAGFPTHPHNDMEIVTYVLSGSLEHKDSLGNGSVIRPGEIQRMSAGRGIRHSEFNHSPDEPVHLLQIWILPEQQGLDPGYEQKTINVKDQPGQLRLIAARDGRDGAVTIHQDASIYAGLLGSGDPLIYELDPNRYVWLQVARGTATLNGEDLRAGDGVAVAAEAKLNLATDTGAEVLLFDLA